MSRTILLTLDDYAALVEDDERFRSELVGGMLVHEPRPGARHGAVQAALAQHLRTWAHARGALVTTESGYVLSADPATLRGPDVAVVLDPAARAVVEGGWMTGAPDVVVEVLSPSEASTQVLAKTLEYLEAGSRRVWIVDPEARTVTIFRPDGSAQVLRGEATLTGEETLDGFAVALADVFET